MPLRILLVIALLVGIAGSFALNKLKRSRAEYMMLGVVFILTGGALSLNPNFGETTHISVIGVELVFLGFVLGILGFFKRES